ncbi:unnamed protein product, partial [Effrenium voratum]
AVPQELLQFSFSSCSVELPLLEIQEKVLENLGVLLPLEVQSARLEDVAVSWRGSSCTIVVKARKLVVEAQMRPYQEWAEVLRTAPELASHDAARSFKAALLKAHEQEVLSLARRLLGREAMGASLVPDLELELGNDQGGFELLMEHQATARICVTGQTLALQGGLCLRDVLSPSKAWRLDLRLRGLSAHCQVDGPTSTPCIGPCQLQLDFTFGKRGSAVPDWMFVEAGNEEELPKVSLTVTSRSCPIRASIRQISALSKHGVSWGRWFALKEAVTVEFEEAMMESSPLSEVAQRGEAAEYRRLWMSRLPRRLESAQVRKETKDTDKDANGAEAEDDDDESAASDTDPQIVAFEEAHLLRETLRQRRLALLEESVVDDENRTYVYSAQRCLCTSAVSGNMILQDPTARHTFVLTVNLTSSEVELLDEQSKLTVAPTSEESSIYVQLGVHDHPALKPLDLSLTLDQCQLLRSGADLPLLTLRRFWLAMDLAQSDPELAVRSREMPGLAPEAKLDPLRMHLGVESLQGCFSYLALMAVMETIQQLQEGGCCLKIDRFGHPDEDTIGLAHPKQLWPKHRCAAWLILAMIRDARPGQPPEPSNVKDYRIHTSGAPITLLMPVQSASADVDESVLGPSFLGLLVVQLLAECGPAQIEPELGDVVCHRMPPSAAAASVWEVQGLAAWLLPEPLGRELLAVGAAEAPVRPAHLLLSCGRLWCEATSDFRRAEVRVDPLLLQLEASEVLLLAQLLRSFESGDSDDAKAEAPEAEPGVAPVLDVAVAGMSLQVLRPSRKAAKGVLHEVVAVLDLGSTHLQLGEEKLKLRLQHVLLSDAVQNFFLLRWQDAQGSAPCVELRKDAHGARLVLRHLQVGGMSQWW